MANEKVIDLHRLIRYDKSLKKDANILQRSTAYQVNQFVYKGNTYLKCITAGTTSSVTLNLSSVSVGDILNDGTVVWEVFNPFTGGSGISNWTTNTAYSVGDLVIYDNNIYQCNTNHTSTTFTADASNWTLIGGQGASEELYSSNTWLDTDTNLTLSSAVTPYDFIIIKVDYSLDGTNTEISKTIIATNALSTNISLTLNRNSTQYCVLEGQLTSSTVFAVDALELTGFTKFRINKIIGVIGGGGSSGGGDTPATSAQIQSLF